MYGSHFTNLPCFRKPAIAKTRHLSPQVTLLNASRYILVIYPQNPAHIFSVNICVEGRQGLGEDRKGGWAPVGAVCGYTAPLHPTVHQPYTACLVCLPWAQGCSIDHRQSTPVYSAQTNSYAILRFIIRNIAIFADNE